MAAPDTDAPSRHRYVALTTYRRSGDPVTTPVWIAELGDGTTVVSTGATAGKVKRLRHTARVELRPCNGRGRVSADAPTWTGTAEVVDGEAASRVRDALRDKYGWQMKLIEWWANVRHRPSDEVGLVIHLVDPD